MLIVNDAAEGVAAAGEGTRSIVAVGVSARRGIRIVGGERVAERRVIAAGDRAAVAAAGRRAVAAGDDRADAGEGLSALVGEPLVRGLFLSVPVFREDLVMANKIGRLAQELNDIVVGNGPGKVHRTLAVSIPTILICPSLDKNRD